MNLAFTALARALSKALNLTDFTYEITRAQYSIHIGLSWISLIRIDQGLQGTIVLRESTRARWSRTTILYDEADLRSYNNVKVREYHLSDPLLIPKLIEEIADTLKAFETAEQMRRRYTLIPAEIS